MRDQRHHGLLLVALAILVIHAALLALAIFALRDPRVSFPVVPRPAATTPAKP